MLVIFAVVSMQQQNCDQNRTKYPDWLDRAEYPFKSHFFNTTAGRMHYVDEGNGDPVVMVHGNPGWSFEFRHIISSISDQYRCIAVDHIGFGLSDKPADWNYLPKNHARNFEELIDYLGLKNITLIVSDWGGPIALSYAIKHPEKIKKLIILNTWMWSVRDDPYYQKFSNMMGGSFGKFMISNFNIFAKVVVRQVFGDKSKLTKRIQEHYYKHLSTPSERKGSYVFPRQIIESSAWLDELWYKKQDISNLPTVFIWGMKDIAFREKELSKWLSNWHSARVFKLTDVGHYPQEEAPEYIINELVFAHDPK